MSRHIKLIWDIRGADAKLMAEHHVQHLKEYMALEKLEVLDTGLKEITDMYSTAYMIVHEKNMIQVRDALKPHRGEFAS